MSVLLRKAQILGARLDHQPLSAWVQWELNGYPDLDSLPEYRKMGTVQVLGDFQGSFGSGMKNAPIAEGSVDEVAREALFSHAFFESVAWLEATMSASARGSQASGILLVPWPTDALTLYGQRLYENMVCRCAHKVISEASVAGVLDSVRNKLLMFALEIEKIEPQAGEAPPGEPAIDAMRVSQIFNTNIYGGHNLVAAGNRDVTQKNELHLTVEWEELAGDLRTLGIADADIDDLHRALEADARQSAPGTIGPATQGWLGRMTTRLATGSLVLAGDVGANVIADLLLKATGAA